MIDSPTGRKRSRESDVEPVTDSTFLKDLHMSQLIKRFRQDEEGAALVEYGLLVGLIAVICIAAVTLVGQEISNAFSSIAAALPAV